MPIKTWEEGPERSGRPYLTVHMRTRTSLLCSFDRFGVVELALAFGKQNIHQNTNKNKRKYCLGEGDEVK